MFLVSRKLADEVLPLPLKLCRIEVGPGTIHMEEIVTINDEMHADYGLGSRNAASVLENAKSAFRAPKY
jgi:hypothetical protein